MPCNPLVLGRRSCILYLPKWNLWNISIDAHVRDLVANDTPMNHPVVFSWASHARRSLHMDYLGVHGCK